MSQITVPSVSEIVATLKGYNCDIAATIIIEEVGDGIKIVTAFK